MKVFTMLRSTPIGHCDDISHSRLPGT